jgi:hypothetical protein
MVATDFKGKFEHIAKNLAYVSQQHNISKPLTHENSNEGTPKPPYQYYAYNPKHMIAEKFKEIIEYVRIRIRKVSTCSHTEVNTETTFNCCLEAHGFF